MSIAKFATLIPPKLVTPASVGSNPGAARMVKVVEFYSKLPKGPAPKVNASVLNPVGKYYQKHFTGKDQSAAPIVHIMLGGFLIGYTMHYNLHLKHHKNNAH